MSCVVKVEEDGDWRMATPSAKKVGRKFGMILVGSGGRSRGAPVVGEYHDGLLFSGLYKIR